jgi:hypothetical protein
VQINELNELAPPELADHLRDIARQRRWQNNTIIVFADGEASSLRAHLPAALPTFVVIDGEEQMRIQEADSPTAATLNIMINQMSRSQLAPYETTKPVIGGQFFGRRSEINKVLQHPDTNYLFIGIRRIGKTSLLHEIERRMNLADPPQGKQVRRLYVDCTVLNSEDEFLRTLAYQLDPAEVKLLMRGAAESKRYQKMMFDRFASLHEGPVTFLIDELDRMLARIGNEWDLFDVLRSASIAGKARFIMAGFRRAMIASTNQKSPFFNLATVIRLGRLRRSDVKRMVVVPMERLRVTIQNQDGVVSRIYRETAGMPNYVQFYCKTLLEQLDEEERDVITEQDLGSIYEHREFRDFVLDTFMSNTESLERALVYALVAEGDGAPQQRSYSQRHMDAVLKKRRLHLRYEQLDRACRSLEVAGIFNQVGRDFEFAIPLFKRMIRQTRDVEFLFDKTREEIISKELLLSAKP